MNFQLNADIHWSSDWSGHEVGFPDIPVVGLYTLTSNNDVVLFINMENNELIHAEYFGEE